MMRKKRLFLLAVLALAASASLSGQRLMNQAPDLSRDFVDMTSIYFFAEKLSDFNTATGEGKVQEVISYVFEGEDPLQIDTKSFGVENFLELYPQMKTYGPGLAFDVVIRTGGQPVTVELTQGEQTVCFGSCSFKGFRIPFLLLDICHHETYILPTCCHLVNVNQKLRVPVTEKSALIK